MVDKVNILGCLRCVWVATRTIEKMFTASSGLDLLIFSKFILTRKNGRKKEEQLVKNYQK